MISLFCLRSQPNEEANLAAKEDSAAPLDGSRLLRLEELADSLIRETERLCWTRSDSVDVDESVEVLQLRAMLRAEALRDGMWLRDDDAVLRPERFGKPGGSDEEEEDTLCVRLAAEDDRATGDVLASGDLINILL